MKQRILKNVKLLDGVNFFGEVGHIAINNHKITQIELDLSNIDISNSEIIDYKNQFLTPSFIDVHSHSDVANLSNFELASKKSSGFGYEIVGNCGLSAFPISNYNRLNLNRIYYNYQVPLEWNNYQEYSQKLSENNIGIKTFSLVGHNTLHSAVCGYEQNGISDNAIKNMKSILGDELDAGALGLSLGLLYAPGRYASREEIVELLKIVAQKDKIVTIHLNNEGDEIIESIESILSMMRDANANNLHISHLKTSGQKNFYKLDEIFNLIENSSKTHDVLTTFDRYPYCSSLTQLSIIGPDKFLRMVDADIMKTLQNSEKECEEFKQYITLQSIDKFQKIKLINSNLNKYKPFLGKSILDIAIAFSANIEDVVLELIKDDSVNALASFDTMSELNMERIVTHNLCMLGTDEVNRPIDYSLGRSHERNFGSSAKFIEILIKNKFSESEIIKKLSYNVAKRFKLENIGELKIGYDASFNLIDFTKIKTNATTVNPHEISTGIKLIEI